MYEILCLASIWKPRKRSDRRMRSAKYEEARCHQSRHSHLPLMAIPGDGKRAKESEDRSRDVDRCRQIQPDI